MKIVADDQIPLIDELFTDAILVKKPGQDIQPADLTDADMLWVRTITRVDAQLLQNTSVRFVGTATAGFDHLDIEWLEQQGIAWGYAPGANAIAVAEYVLCVIAALRTRNLLSDKPLRAGVIGVGHVGREVAKYLKQIGLEVIVNDPPRAMREPEFHSIPLEEFKDLDFLSLHPALTRSGAYPSYHLLDNAFLQRQKPGMVLLNASRGEVVDTAVLLEQSHLHLCFDVWEHEPAINLQLLRRAMIATPHIAGYSVDAKRRASLLLYQQARDLMGLPDKTALYNLPQNKQGHLINWEKSALAIFNPLELTQTMQDLLLNDTGETAKKFLRMRKEYIWRESFV